MRRDVNGTFRLLDELDAPDVWEDIVERVPGHGPTPSPTHRLMTAAVAFAVFAVGGFAAWVALRPSETGLGPVDESAPPAASDACGEPTSRATITLSETLSFDVTCLAVPAGQPFTLEFRNAASGVQANVSIYDAGSLAESRGCTDPACPPGADPFFQGAIIMGPDVIVYEVPALGAGMYVMQDDVHPAANAQLLVTPTAHVDALVEIEDGYRVYSDVFDMGGGELLPWELVLLRTDGAIRPCDDSGLALAYRDGESTDWQSCPAPYFSFEVFLGEADILIVGALDPRVDSIRIGGDQGRSAEGLIFPLSAQVETEFNAFVMDASQAFPGTLTALDADGVILQEQNLVAPDIPSTDQGFRDATGGRGRRSHAGGGLAQRGN
jgi:hypothetical protein